MAATPLLEEVSGGPSGAMIAGLAGLPLKPAELARIEMADDGLPQRKLAIYQASAGFDLVEELDHLAVRTLESNIFFNPRFLAPAMPRLDDREVRLAVIRDGGDDKSRLRLLVPFSVERAPVPLASSIMRVWANPFGPLGTPLVDRDDPEGVLRDFFAMLSRPHLKLPKVMVMPDLRLDGAFVAVLRRMAETGNLPIETMPSVERAFLDSRLDGDEYLKQSLRSHHYREFRRLKRRLADKGVLEYHVARTAEEVFHATEAYLALEAAGWKGREHSAMAIDRFRAAFAREAVHGLAELDLARVHSLTLDGKLIASLIVFIEAGIGYTWKTAYDEAFSAYSPGTLLMIEVTKQHLDDPNIVVTDSCAVPGHPVMDRLWSERRPIGTILLGTTPDAGRATRQAASQLHLYRETRNLASALRNRVRSLIRR
ncbi:MAG: GNAT family N-acetyltransferase [Rhizobiaceae bacterium]